MEDFISSWSCREPWESVRICSFFKLQLIFPVILSSKRNQYLFLSIKSKSTVSCRVNCWLPHPQALNS